MLVRTLKTLAILVFMLAMAPQATSQDAIPFPFTLEGDWWVSIGGNRGAMRINFGSIGFGNAEVQGAGISRDFEAGFTISETVPQTMSFQSNRQIVGSLILDDLDRTGPIGTLTITRGKLSNTKNELRLQGTLELVGRPAKKVRMKGGRMPSSPPDLQGRSTDFRIRGSGLFSNKYDLSLVNNETLGFPFLDLISGGPVRIDSVETPGIVVVGTAIVGPRGKVYSEIASHPSSTVDMGDGFGFGRQKTPKAEGLRPVLSLKTSTSQRRRCNFRGVLLEIRDR